MRATYVQKPMMDRFWAKIEVADPDDCWLWHGATNDNGYGHFYVDPDRRTQLAPRVAWFLAFGEWPAMFVLHRCDTPPCCNPRHLFLGTHTDNAVDRVQKGRSAHIKLSDEQVLEIRRLRATGMMLRDLSELFRVNKSTICKIARGQARRQAA